MIVYNQLIFSGWLYKALDRLKYKVKRFIREKCDSRSGYTIEDLYVKGLHDR